MEVFNGSTLRGCVLFHFKNHTNHSSAKFNVLTAVLLKLAFFQVLRSCRLKKGLPVFQWSPVSSAFRKKLLSNC